MIKPKRTNKKGVATRAQIMQYLHEYHAKHGYMPSYREIGAAINISSTATIYMHMQYLINEGLLESEHLGSPRAFRFGKNNQNLEEVN